MSNASLTVAAMLKAAGVHAVRHPEPTELFVDIDSDEAYTVFQQQYQILLDRMEVTGVIKDGPSRSGLPHRHVIVKMMYPVASPLERVALQAMLGSDLKHELLSYLASKAGNPSPTVFFE